MKVTKSTRSRLVVLTMIDSDSILKEKKTRDDSFLHFFPVYGILSNIRSFAAKAGLHPVPFVGSC